MDLVYPFIQSAFVHWRVSNRIWRKSFNFFATLWLVALGCAEDWRNLTELNGGWVIWQISVDAADVANNKKTNWKAYSTATQEKVDLFYKWITNNFNLWRQNLFTYLHWVCTFLINCTNCSSLELGLYIWYIDIQARWMDENL